MVPVWVIRSGLITLLSCQLFWGTITASGDYSSRPKTVCAFQPFLPQTATSNSLSLMEVIEIDILELWYQPKLN